MGYSTGIAVLLLYDASIGGGIHADPEVPGLPGPGPYGYGKAGVSASIGSLGVSGSASALGKEGILAGGAWTIDLTAGGNSYHDSGIGVFDFDLSGGSISLSVPCVVCFEDVPAAPGDTNEWFGHIPDYPPYTQRNFYLIATGDGSATITFAGQTCAGTAALTGSRFDAAGYSASATADSLGSAYDDGTVWATADGSANATLATTDTTIRAGGVTSASASASSTSTTAHTSITATASGSGGTGSVSASGTNGGAAEGDITAFCDRKFDLSGVLRAMQDAYPGSLTLLCARYLGDTGDSFSGGSTFTRTGTQESWVTSAGAGAGLVSNSDSHSKNTYAPVGVVMDSASLTSLGEDPRINRVLMRDRLAPGLTLAHTSDVAIVAPFGSVAATGSGSQSVTSGVLTVTTSGAGSGGATLTYLPEQGAAGHRYLRLHLRSVTDASVPITLSIPPCIVDYSDATQYGTGMGGGTPIDDPYADGGGAATPTKVWNITTGAAGTWINVDIDLCAPDVAGDDAQDTCYPRPTRFPLCFGVWRIGQIVLAGIPASRHIEIDAISFVESPVSGAPGAKYTIVPTFYPYKYNDGGGISDPSMEDEWPVRRGPTRQISANISKDYVRAFLQGNSDDRLCLEEYDFWYVRTYADPEEGGSGTVTYAFLPQSIAQMADAINASDATEQPGDVLRWPGWTAGGMTAPPGTPWTDPLPPPDSYYYNSDLPSTFLAGAGAMWVPAEDAGAWDYAFDKAMGGISAQPLFDVITWVGIEGDILGVLGLGVGYGAGRRQTDGAQQVLVLRAAAILRAQANGLVLDNTSAHAPIGGVSVALTDALTSAARGSGTSWAVGGGYATRLSYMYGVTGIVSKSGTATAMTGSDPALTDIMYARHRHRFTFAASPSEAGASPWLLSRDDGLTWRAFLISGAVMVWRCNATPVGGVPWPVQVTAIPSGPWTEPRLAGYPSGRLCLTAVLPSDPNLYASISDDDGLTWSTPAVAIPSATHGTIAVRTDTDERLVLGWVDDGTMMSPPLRGTLQATFQRGDGAPTAVFPLVDSAGTHLLAEDDQFHVSCPSHGAAQWLLTVRIYGETQVSEWVSSEEPPASWVRLF